MIVVRMIGGLGNQMFQYALYRNFLERGEDVYYEGLEIHKFYPEYELDIDTAVDTIKRPIKSLDEIKHLRVFNEQTWPKYNPEILELKDVYLHGNWQNIGYFPDEKILRKEYKFIKELDSKNKEILHQIQETNSVSVHVRRADYTKMPGYFFQANWMNYYGPAVTHISKNAKNKPLKFFVFSDDIPWCKSNFMIPATYVENKKQEAWKDMLLMSNCKHNITGNSTFSWWGAWLNENPDKIVVTPKNWISGIDSNLITLKEWIKI